MRMHHYTNKTGFDSIRASTTWIFRASRPPADHPFGAYFTTLGPETKNLAKKLGISWEKTHYVFVFEDGGDLLRIRGGRGDYIFYSNIDYSVDGHRKLDHGEVASVAGRSSIGSGEP